MKDLKENKEPEPTINFTSSKKKIKNTLERGYNPRSALTKRWLGGKMRTKNLKQLQFL